MDFELSRYLVLKRKIPESSDNQEDFKPLIPDPNLEPEGWVRNVRWAMPITLYLQYGFVFGITNLFALTSATLFGTLGRRIGAKSIYNFGSFLQGLYAISFGCLTFVDHLATFLFLSYFLR